MEKFAMIVAVNEMRSYAQRISYAMTMRKNACGILAIPHMKVHK